ncbi:MAG: efflux RND transporter periplasmic adaptor subunit, partial [Candidatus Gastranaerophilales bacterium]|nr:efflux RND transporter periplasmic adaptor subunit [Candidatus Gastranaerophilales bacterium]
IEPTFETTGRIEAKDSISVIARVDGWLEERYFEEGDIVKKGQKLYQIQPDEYKLAMQDAAARVNENAAVYQNALTDYKRAAILIKDEMVSREYYDNAVASRNSKKASLDAARAQLAKARLNLSYTTVTAPMDGRIGKTFVSPGNYVTASTGKMAEIHKTSPIQVKFAVKSANYIYLKKYSQSKKIVDKLNVEVRLKLSDGSIYDKVGKIEFMNNQIDKETGTVSFRAIFDNPDEILVPGDFVNVILTVKHPVDVMIIPQDASKTDLGTGYYVWVVKDGKSVKKNIIVNDNIDNNWIVEKGLDFNDDVVIKGLQSINHEGQPLKIQRNENAMQKTEKSPWYKKIIKKVMGK